MDRPWYFELDGQPYGPMGGDGVITLAQAGMLNERSPVWTPGWDQWRLLRDVPELTEYLEELQDNEQVAKRQRLNGADGAGPQEIAGWAAALDKASQVALFEKALFTHLEAAIREQPGLRDQLLTTYIQRHPASDDRDPEGYDFTDEFLLDAVEDFESQEQMWEVLGKDNRPTVLALISVAARLDQRYCAELQNLALLSRARVLLRAGDDGLADADPLVQLLQQEPALELARDHQGRSLWHEVVAAEQDKVLERLLPLLHTDAADEPAGQQAAGGEPAGEQAAGGQAADGQAAGGQAADGQAACEQAAGGEPAGEQAVDGQAEQQAAAPGGAGRPGRLNPLNLTDLNGNAPLHLAAEQCSPELTSLLLDAGADIDLQNRDPSKYSQGNWQVRTRDLEFTLPVPSVHQTALHISSELGDLDTMKLLIERGAALDLRDVSGKTPLHLAVEERDEGAAELLIDGGADPNLASSDMAEGATCLTLAASLGRPKMLRLLLGSRKLASSAVNAAEADQGFTPLMLAARKGNAECVQMLLDAGADPAAVNHAGKTAHDIAQVNKKEAAIEVLQRHAAGGGQQNGSA
ncbi:ankyrin repeat and kinase domain-containing 1 [Chlorella sorokiniana]|uniref:Ankyrin repeat and kinase domain-containing 1 n=1 Tax=Chlorella sorokiniana TaxID=3076 RepID=A0A2P6U064_CHLSO|nr:ankyrin repeat and kinase domain-containing 1 [Chlorella sorokiniana]|eukprot:PRW59698.1 ankyrin repeat and kinase domain-containing 1 [Chlorella sorokiniana]